LCESNESPWHGTIEKALAGACRPPEKITPDISKIRENENGKDSKTGKTIVVAILRRAFIVINVWKNYYRAPQNIRVAAGCST
jgi:hypothetical protein